jgi:hypothetical protein
MAYSEKQRSVAISKVVAGLRIGTPLTVICSEDGMPCDDTVRIWADENTELSREIARAREAGFDALAVEALQIVDAAPERVVTVTGDDRSESRIDSASVQWAKNRAETRLKLLAKWDPKRYGDKQLVGSDPDNPLPSGVQVIFKKAGEE